MLVGMFIAGALLDGFLGTDGTFKLIFTAAGGVIAVGAFFGGYFKRRLKMSVWRSGFVRHRLIA